MAPEPPPAVLAAVCVLGPLVEPFVAAGPAAVEQAVIRLHPATAPGLVDVSGVRVERHVNVPEGDAWVIDTRRTPWAVERVTIDGA